MKPSLFALFFLFAFIASSAKAEVVLDAKGEPLRNGASYYILPYIWAFGGGLNLTKTDNETCPLSVFQSPSEVDNGLPWTIRSPLKISLITTDTKVDFFSVKGKVPSCVPLSSKWTIVEGEHGIKYVKIRGFKNTLKGWFYIKHYKSRAYKIVFCPTNGHSCGDIGVSSDRRLLVVTNDHTNFAYVFFKVKSSGVLEQVINNVLEA